MMRIRTCVLMVWLAAVTVPVASAQKATASAQHEPAASFDHVSHAADQARDEGRSVDAIRLYKQALALRPSWKDGLWSLGSLLYEENQYAETCEVLRRFLAIDPELGLGWALLGMSEFQTRDYSRALDHLERAMAQGMGDQKDIAQSVFYYVAVLQNRFEQFEESMGLLMTMVKAGQNASPLTEAIGLTALRLPLLPSEIPPDRRQLIRIAGEGALAMEGQRRDEAERLFSDMANNYPDEPGVHFLYGAFLMDVRPQDGIREMQRELQISPFSVPARLRIAEEYIKEARTDEALPLAQEATKLDPKRGVTHMMLGEVLVTKGDVAGGIVELEAAREKSPDTIRIRWDLLRAYTSSGRTEDAKREKEEIEKLSHPAAER
jgi:tetratricopeptide (TPR) repeat protein